MQSNLSAKDGFHGIILDFGRDVTAWLTDPLTGKPFWSRFGKKIVAWKWIKEKTAEERLEPERQKDWGIERSEVKVRTKESKEN